MVRHGVRLAVVVSLAVSLFGCGDHAQRSEAQAACSNQLLNGAYITASDGFVATGSGASQRTPFAQAGRDAFNGEGIMSGHATISLNGVMTTIAYMGTYDVEPDCSGEMRFTDENGQVYNFDLVVEPDGLEFGIVQVDAGIVHTGVERRQASTQTNCSSSTLQGSYALTGDGFVTAGSGTDRPPFATGRLEGYRGDGTLSGIVTQSANGVIHRASYDGTYTLSSNCSGTVTSGGDGQTESHFDVFVDPSGAELAYVGSDANIVTSGYGRRQ